MAFDPGFKGGVRVDTADLSGTGRQDILAAAGPGGFPMVQVVDGRSFARGALLEVFDHSFSGGVYVAGARLDASGADRIVVGSGPGASVVREFDGSGRLLHDSVPVFEPGYNGGVQVGAVRAFGQPFDVILVAAASDHAPDVLVLDANFNPLPFGFT